jgi:hypothetical protein
MSSAVVMFSLVILIIPSYVNRYRIAAAYTEDHNGAALYTKKVEVQQKSCG